PDPGGNGDGDGERRGKRSAADALGPHPSCPPPSAPNSIPPAARRGNHFSTSALRGRGAAPRCANPWQKKEPLPKTAAQAGGILESFHLYCTTWACPCK